MATSQDEFFKQLRRAPLRRLVSDDEQFDEMFPSHPLTLVRKRLKRIEQTLRIDKNWPEYLSPFRLGEDK